MKKKDDYSTFEVIRSGLIGFGAAATVFRLEAAIRPSKKFVVTELGIAAFTAYVFLHTADKALAYFHATKKDVEKGENPLKKQVKEFGEWLAKEEKDEEKKAEDLDNRSEPFEDDEVEEDGH